VQTLLLLCALGLAVGLGAVLLWRGLRRAGADEALISWRGESPGRVRFGRAWTWAVLGRMETLDLSVRRVVVERRGRQGLSCRDGLRVDVRATFLVKVERREADVLRVAREVGRDRVRSPEALLALLEERLAGALEASVATFTLDELLADRGLFVDHVGVELGDELLGFRLERLSLGRLEQTPLDQLDPTNVQDARGIEKLNERATRLAQETAGALEPGAPRGHD
jgi:uncharacterized membrane protein YqiK